MHKTMIMTIQFKQKHEGFRVRGDMNEDKTEAQHPPMLTFLHILMQGNQLSRCCSLAKSKMKNIYGHS